MKCQDCKKTVKGLFLLLFIAVFVSGCSSSNPNPPAPTPSPDISISIANASVAEGNDGVTTLNFPVSLSVVSSSEITFNYATENGTALGDSDFISASDTITIPIDTTVVNIPISIQTDTDFEEDETFTITISNPSGDVILGNSVAIGTILNDDAQVTNVVPLADAGIDQTVRLGAVVQLDASSSTDTEGVTLMYLWSQTGGTPVALSSVTAELPTFTAPTTAATLTFSLVVNDGVNNSIEDTVLINVSLPSNVIPIANAGIDQTVIFDDLVQLNASSSKDPDVTYLWTQIGGTGVTLSSATAQFPTFTAERIIETLIFSLVVNDGLDDSLADTVRIIVNPPVNKIPIADAGADQTVNFGDLVQLNSSLSKDPEDVTLTYLWSQISGTTVTLNSTLIGFPTFTAPTVASVLTFSLVVNDGVNDSIADTVVITVAPTANVAPIANAGVDQTVVEGSLVVLDGSQSDDPDAAVVTLTHLWTQTAGTAVTLSSTTAEKPTFTAATGLTANELLTFTLVVNDGTDNSLVDTVIITVTPTANVAPIANAGIDQTIVEGSLVVLDGSQSSDPDAAVLMLNHLWTQTGGTAVTLSSTTVEKPTFTAPTGLAANELLTFSLVVNDGTDNSLADLVIITVTPANVAPIAHAGIDQTTIQGILFELDGSLSSDPDAAVLMLNYLWTQTGGTAVTLSSTTVPKPTFTTPTGLTVAESLTFTLVVNDGKDNSLLDTVIVLVTPPENIKSGIDHYWSLNELSGTTSFANSVGTLLGACVNCPTSVTGVIGNAQQFDGINNEITLAPDVSFNWPLVQNFSIEFWMNSAAACSATGSAVIGRIDSGTSLSWWVGCKNSNAAFTLTDKAAGTTDTVVTGSSIVTDGKWHHIVAIRDTESGLVKLYVDGIVESTSTESFTAGFDSATAELKIGNAGASGGGLHFTGMIDEVALHSSVLSDFQIKQHYNDATLGVHHGYIGCPTTLPIKIMPLGDSITFGSGGNQIGGYRNPLYKRLIADGYNIDFVGRVSDVGGTSFDVNHEGYSGSTSGDIANILNAALIANPPDVILLHLGTNDILATNLDSVTGIVNVLNMIDTFDTNIVVVLAKIINKNPFDSITASFNGKLETMALARIAAGDKIWLIDQESALDYAVDLSIDDGIHPNDVGYRKMALVWDRELKRLIPACTPVVPTFALQTAPLGYVGQLLNNKIIAVGHPFSDYSLAIRPTGMRIHSNLGDLNWIPNTSGSFSADVLATNSVGTSSLTVPVHIYPDSSYINIAPAATMSASSETVFQAAVNAVDGIVDGFPGDTTKEWSSEGEDVGAWVFLDWGTSNYSVDRVILYDRPIAVEHVLSGELTFSDGSTVSVGALNNDGRPTVISFPAKITSSVQFTVFSVSATSANIGLAEIEVIGSLQ